MYLHVNLFNFLHACNDLIYFISKNYVQLLTSFIFICTSFPHRSTGLTCKVWISDVFLSVVLTSQDLNSNQLQTCSAGFNFMITCEMLEAKILINFPAYLYFRTYNQLSTPSSWSLNKNPIPLYTYCFFGIFSSEYFFLHSVFLTHGIQAKFNTFLFNFP